MKKIITVGHGDHGKTTLTEAMKRVNSEIVIVSDPSEQERGITIQESINQDNSLKFINHCRLTNEDLEIKSGRERRRERRSKERKLKK